MNFIEMKVKCMYKPYLVYGEEYTLHNPHVGPTVTPFYDQSLYKVSVYRIKLTTALRIPSA